MQRTVRSDRAARFSRPGLTLLEMVLSVLILGLIAATLMNAVGYIVGVEARTRRLIAANELANRLILQYLDDDDSMPQRSKPLEYGEHMYTWDIQVQPVSMDPSSPIRDVMSSVAMQFMSRFKLVTIAIYEAEPSSSGGVITGEPLATLSRVFDPTTVRNPDAMDRMDESDVQELVGTLTGFANIDVDGAAAAQGMGRGRAGERGNSRSRR